MGGGLMQLVAYGAQDIYLTGNPQITFFKVVYRRHTNFSMESIQQTWAGTFSSTGQGRCTATIARNGDLVNRLYVEIPDTAGGSRTLDWSLGRNPTAQWIDTVECEIGGQTIDRQYGHWMEAWAELTEPNPSGFCVNSSYDGTKGGTDNGGTTFQLMSGMGGGYDTATDASLFVPLRFWFCENPGLALPLIALQYHEVKIILTGKSLSPGRSGYTTRGMNNAVLWADYIYLDTDERRRFAQVSHEYLITQIQYQNFSTDNSTCTLTFNHPVKELVWTGKWYGPDAAAEMSTFGSASAVFSSQGSFEPLADNSKFQLKLNGHDRFAARDRNYFTMSQVWQYHTGFGSLSASMATPTNDSTALGNGNHNGQAIAVYSFALKPEEHQPSGTCNFSRIDNAQLVTTGLSSSLGDPTALPNNIYAVNYNVLRIMSGMGGLAYSN
jgi:hypothetical protein